ncbi:hypothetical protein D3C85_1718560 [compost metagenome]
MQSSSLLQFVHDRGHAAGAVEAFAEVFASRHAIDQQWHVFTDALPVFQTQVDAGVTGDGDQVRRAIGRSAQGRRHGNCILERFAGHDL